MKRVVVKTTPAFTRIELLACVLAAALLGHILASAIALSANRGDRVACFNNLRQIGAAYAQFGMDHDNLMTWAVPMSDGGNYDYPFKNNPFVQFSVLSNFIASPRVLMDPADDRSSARCAVSWDNTRQGGLLYSAFRNNAVSYFLGLDGNFTTPALMLSGDRNLKHDGISGCSSGIAPAANLNRAPSSMSAWTNAVHGLSGNIVLYDGSVHEVDTPTLRRIANHEPFGDGSGSSYHILLPY